MKEFTMYDAHIIDTFSRSFSSIYFMLKDCTKMKTEVLEFLETAYNAFTADFDNDRISKECYNIMYEMYSAYKDYIIGGK